MPVEIPKDKWPGSVRQIVIGATPEQGGTRKHSVVVGGENCMPYMHFEGSIPNAPLIALEIRDRKPEDWSALLRCSGNPAARYFDLSIPLTPARWD